MKTGIAATALAVIAGVVLSPTAFTIAAPASTDRIDIAYIPPENPAHRPLYDSLRNDRALEKMREILSPFRLPHRVLIKSEDCGTANAWYEDGVITICYEYLQDVREHAPIESTPGKVAPIDAVLGPFFDVVLHEFGHALIDILDLPVLGREEDAADQIAAYMMLQFGKQQTRRLIRGAAQAYHIELKAPDLPVSAKSFASVHGLPAQRFFNLLCIAYGADPDLFRDIVEGGPLPAGRAEGCELEYKQVAYAFHTLVRPHVDQARAREVLSSNWLPDVKTPPPHKPDAKPSGTSR